jgi:predicted amidohydrolase YtcJ
MPTLFACLIIAAASAAEPDLILAHGKVFLGPGRYAQALAVTGNRISAVGRDAEVLSAKGEKTRVVDLQGRAVTPGFHDAHARLLRGALLLLGVDLSGSATTAEVQKKLADFAAAHPKSEWIVGRGWDHEAFLDGSAPTKLDLDAVVSTRPVALTDSDGDTLWMNSEGLRRARLTPTSPGLHAGDYLKDEKGELAGVFMGEGIAAAMRPIPKPTRAERLEALRRALALARREGVTSIDAMPGPDDPSPAEQIEFWRELNKTGEFTARFFLYGRLNDPQGLAKLKRGAVDIPRDRLDFIGVAGPLDGQIADRTAALLAPYFDEKTGGGLRHQQFALNALVREAHELGFQAALRAAGDKAVRSGLDACQRSEEAAKKEERILPLYPCRIESAELVDPADLPRFAALRAAASVSPARLAFADITRNYYPNRLGARVRQSFPWKSLEDGGALLLFGSDWPSNPFSPRLALFAAATRESLDGAPAGGWMPKEKLSLENAVQHSTADPAKAIGKADILGRIAPGQLADLAVFDRDLFAASGVDLLKAQIDLTVYNGRVVFEREKP